MEPVEFRKLGKETIRGRIPIALETWVRKTAASRRISISAALTECIALAKGDNPQTYGIAAGRRRAKQSA